MDVFVCVCSQCTQPMRTIVTYINYQAHSLIQTLPYMLHLPVTSPLALIAILLTSGLCFLCNQPRIEGLFVRYTVKPNVFISPTPCFDSRLALLVPLYFPDLRFFSLFYFSDYQKLVSDIKILVGKP